MKRTQLYIQEELHEILSLFAKARGWSLSRAVRKAIEEFVEKPKVKRIAKKEIKKIKRENPLMNMAGIIKAGPDLASGVDEIYDEV